MNTNQIHEMLKKIYDLPMGDYTAREIANILQIRNRQNVLDTLEYAHYARACGVERKGNNIYGEAIYRLS